MFLLVCAVLVLVGAVGMLLREKGVGDIVRDVGYGAVGGLILLGGARLLLASRGGGVDRP